MRAYRSFGAFGRPSRLFDDFHAKALLYLASPQFWSIKLLGHFDGDFKIATFNGQFEARLGILDELKSNLRISFLL